MQTQARQELEQSIVSTEQFPIRLSKVWEELGYSRKDNCERSMVASLEEGEDYTYYEFSAFMRKTQEGRPVKEVALSRDGFKMLAMMARTTEGRKMRK